VSIAASDWHMPWHMLRDAVTEVNRRLTLGLGTLAKRRDSCYLEILSRKLW